MSHVGFLKWLCHLAGFKSQWPQYVFSFKLKMNYSFTLVITHIINEVCHLTKYGSVI